MRRALIKLKGLGLVINENKILDKHGHYIPLNYIIKEVGQIADNRKTIAERLGVKRPSEEEIIKHFFKNRKVNKLEECYINFSHILKLRKKIGGQLILNHPGKAKRINESLIAQLKKLGLDGIEVISPHHDIRAVMQLQRLTRRYKLIMTGGSDYHLDEGGEVAIKNVYAYFKIEPKYLTGLDKIIG